RKSPRTTVPAVMYRKTLTPRARAERRKRVLIIAGVALFVIATGAAALTGGTDSGSSGYNSATNTLDAMLGVMPGALPGASPRVAPNTVRAMVSASRALDLGGGGTAPVPGSIAGKADADSSDVRDARGARGARGARNPLARDSARTPGGLRDSTQTPPTDAYVPVAPLQIRVVQGDRPFACSTQLDLDGMSAAIMQRDAVEMRRYWAP